MPSPSLPSSPCPWPSPGLSRSWVDKTLPEGLRGTGGKGEAGAWAEERLGPEPLGATSAASCGSRRFLRHESGQEKKKKRMNNGIGFLHGLRVPGTRSHTEQGDPLCPHRQRLQRERLRGCDGQ